MAGGNAGSVGRGGGPGACDPHLFFPDPLALQEGERDLAEECMMVQPDPGATLEVVEAQFLLELLVRLLAAPGRLNGR